MMLISTRTGSKDYLSIYYNEISIVGSSPFFSVYIYMPVYQSVGCLTEVPMTLTPRTGCRNLGLALRHTGGGSNTPACFIDIL